MTSALAFLLFALAWLAWLSGALMNATLGVEKTPLWRDLWTLQGDVSRARFWGLSSALVAVIIALTRVAALSPRNRACLPLAASLPFYWSVVALTVRRLRAVLGERAA